ncbi:MAG TPA: hypothetical protein VHE81_14715 [Lacipirellulaceae bacterium]|nr:hypothetical protein [Lacipirellulaceae bacterium]
MRSICLAIACSFVGLAAAPANAAIMMTTSEVSAFASDASGASASQNYISSTFPTPPGTMLNATDGASHSNNGIDWSASGGQTILGLTVDHQRTGQLNSIAETDQNNVNFTALDNEPYELSGFYSATDAGAAGRLYLEVRLFDSTASTELFRNVQNSTATLNESFILGASGGDQGNISNGSPTGNLIAGHHYALFSEYLSQASPDADSGAVASGNLTLTIGVAVPEPASTFYLLACGLPLLILSTRRRTFPICA